MFWSEIWKNSIWVTKSKLLLGQLENMNKNVQTSTQYCFKKTVKKSKCKQCKNLEKMRPLENGKILPRLLTVKDTYLLAYSSHSLKKNIINRDITRSTKQLFFLQIPILNQFRAEKNPYIQKYIISGKKFFQRDLFQERTVVVPIQHSWQADYPFLLKYSSKLQGSIYPFFLNSIFSRNWMSSLECESNRRKHDVSRSRREEYSFM